MAQEIVLQLQPTKQSCAPAGRIPSRRLQSALSLMQSANSVVVSAPASLLLNRSSQFGLINFWLFTHTICSCLYPANIDPTRRYLYLQILSGKAFLEHLQEPEPLPGQTTSTFVLHINFRGQRFRSRPVPCACDPDFREGFLLELHKESGGRCNGKTTFFVNGLYWCAKSLYSLLYRPCDLCVQ